MPIDGLGMLQDQSAERVRDPAFASNNIIAPSISVGENATTLGGHVLTTASNLAPVYHWKQDPYNCFASRSDSKAISEGRYWDFINPLWP